MTEADHSSADAEPAPQSNHRRGLLLGAGLLAASAGVGFAWWQAQSKTPTASDEPFAGFWDLHWDSPRGAAVHLQAFRGKPLLINFWATWCPPCIEELPLINAFFNKNTANGWQVLGLAIDKLSSVQGFLQKMPLDFPVAMAGLDGSEVAKRLGNPSGALPFSVVVGSQGGILQRKLGRLHAADLDLWAQLK